MNNSATFFDLKKLKGFADWKLLLLLLLFLNVKLAVKIPAIALIYILQFDFKFGFSFKNSRLPLFYPFMIVIAVVNVFINKSYAAPNYLPVIAMGVFFWLLCILAIHQVKLAVEQNDVKSIHNTLLVFFIINIIISFFNLAVIVVETGTINPYTYQGEYQKYFLSTGDYIKGLTLDTSTTNAIINAFGVLYFFIRRKPVMLLLCMVVLLLTGSNFTNLVILVILIYLFIFKSDKDQKSLLMVCGMFFVVFMAKISPQNDRYVIETFKKMANVKSKRIKPDTLALPLTQRPDSVLNWEEKRQKMAMLYLDSMRALKTTKPQAPPAKKAIFITDAGQVYIPKPYLHVPLYQGSVATPVAQVPLLKFISTHKKELPLATKTNPAFSKPGKVTGMMQTFNYLKQHPGKILTGSGAGNFSSKLAFRVSGIGVTGGYPARYIYINPDFEHNHLDLYLKFFSRRGDFHSLTNSPFSVYDQMLAEYGLLGLIALFTSYIWFFARHYKPLTYGIPIMVLMLMVFFIDYWFEQLSIIILFELLLFLDIKEGQSREVDYAK
ncbi:MAG: hypothetical protein ABI367_12795 [Mucilaginibacter sp.]